MKIDLHVHTSEMSMCAVLSAEETVKLYAESDFDAIVITNHFNSWSQFAVSQKGVTDYYKAYKECFEKAKEYGEKYGLKVFFGCELKTDKTNNDYLVYGAPDEVLSRTNELWKLSAREVRELADEYNFLFYQAHPFRDHMQVTPPHELHGIEVKNCNPRHDSRNDIALAWAEEFNLKGISGSDFHQAEDLARGGIETDVDVTDTAALVEVLRSGNYRIL